MQRSTRPQMTTHTESVTRTFIGQTDDPPYVFFGTVPLSHTDRKFIVTGTIDHELYLAEVSALPSRRERSNTTLDSAVEVVDLTLIDDDEEEAVTPQTDKRNKHSPSTPSEDRPLRAPPTPETPSPIKRRKREAQLPPRSKSTSSSSKSTSSSSKSTSSSTANGQHRSLGHNAEHVTWTAGEDRALWQAQVSLEILTYNNTLSIAQIRRRQVLGRRRQLGSPGRRGRQDGNGQYFIKRATTSTC